MAAEKSESLSPPHTSPPSPLHLEYEHLLLEYTLLDPNNKMAENELREQSQAIVLRDLPTLQDRASPYHGHPEGDLEDGLEYEPAPPKLTKWWSPGLFIIAIVGLLVLYHYITPATYNIYVNCNINRPRGSPGIQISGCNYSGSKSSPAR